MEWYGNQQQAKMAEDKVHGEDLYAPPTLHM